MSEKTISGNSEPVSVAMTTYNGAAFLKEQLASIAGQTHLPRELIIGDDQSTDETLDIIARFSETSPFPVHVTVNVRRLGFADNFLSVVEKCTSDIIAFCDQDDVWMSDKIEICVSRLSGDKSLIALHTAVITDQDLMANGRLLQDISGDDVIEPLQILPVDGHGWGFTMVFQRDLATLIAREFRPRAPVLAGLVAHDIWIYVLAASLGRVSHIDKDLAYYRQHSKNTYGVKSQNLAGRLVSLLTVPMHRHTRRRDFYADTRKCFIEIYQADGIYSANAKRASEVYGRKAEELDLRIDIYLQKNIVKRLRAFASYAKASRVSRNSLAKDFLLGVCGLGRHEII